MILPAWPRRDVLRRMLGGLSATMLANPSRTADAAVVPLIDTHVHFYDPTRPEGVPWPAKTDEVLYRRVLPDEWQQLLAPLGPAGAIVVEASPWVEDNQWLLNLADRHAAQFSAMPGIVCVVGNLPLKDAGYRSHIARLADHGLSLDINGGRAFAAAEAVAMRFPSLNIVLWKTFSPERLIYGSNWPVSNRAADYAAVHAIVAAFARSRGPEAERWFFTNTSRAAYRWV